MPSRGTGRPNGGEVYFPTLGGDTFQQAPCHMEEENLWESRRDREPEQKARERWREAAELCGYCPALAACARLADAQPRLDGVWAGRVPRARGERAGVPRAECGSRGGWQRHDRAGETPCESCVAANRAYHRDRKRRGR